MIRRPLTIGVVGGSGSGKTTVARAIESGLDVDVTFLDQDAYYLDLGHLELEARKQVNFDHPDAFDADLFVAHLEDLIAGRAVDKPTYDFAAHTRAARTVRLVPRDVIVVDGLLLFAEARLRALLDIKVYVDVADDVRFIRRLRRDVAERGRAVEDVIHQYLETVRPMHLEFVEPSKRYADLIIPEGAENEVALEAVVARIKSLAQ